MRLEQFYEFCKVVETGSLRKASEKLYTTPQNVSKSMIQLEQELGVVLYDRVPKGVAVTTEGKIVYDSMKRVIEEIDGMKAALGAKSGGDRRFPSRHGVLLPRPQRFRQQEHGRCIRERPQNPDQAVSKDSWGFE